MKRKIIALTILIGIFILAVGGCDMLGGLFGSAVENYFPLAAGAEWDYTATVELYDDPGVVDFDATMTFNITLYVAGTEVIGGVDTHELKVKDFSTDQTGIIEADVNDMLAGVSVFVAPTAEGLEVFKVEVDQSNSSDAGVDGWASSFMMTGTFSQGLAILPPFIFEGATAEFDFALEDTYIDYMGGDIYYTDVDTTDVDAEVVVTTDGDKIEVLGKDYRGAFLASNVVVETARTRTYPATPASDTASGSTTTTDADLFVAEKIGIAFLHVTMSWGDALDNEGMPHFINLDLTGTTADD